MNNRITSKFNENKFAGDYDLKNGDNQFIILGREEGDVISVMATDKQLDDDSQHCNSTS